MRRHPLPAFFILAIALSWSYWIPDAIAGGHWSHVPGLVGPAIAAAVVATVVGREARHDLRTRTTRVRVPLRWYAAALVPLVVGAVVLVVRGGVDDGIGRMAGFPEVGWFGVAALSFVINGFGEEVGWRGFAWPRLRDPERGDRSLTRAAVLITVPWAVWHLPLLWIDSGMRDFPIVAVPGFVFSLFCGAVVLGWLTDRTAAVAVVALFHTTLNLATATEAMEAAAPFVSVAVIGMALWIVNRRRSSPPAPSDGPSPTVDRGPSVVPRPAPRLLASRAPRPPAPRPPWPRTGGRPTPSRTQPQPAPRST